VSPAATAPSTDDTIGEARAPARPQLGKDDRVELTIDLDRRGDAAVVSPRGEIDFATAGDLKQVLTDALLDGAVHLVVDLDGVDFIESTGLGALIGGRRRALGMDGSFALVCTGSALLDVFRITGLTSVFAIYDSTDEALTALS
jgi:anti-sigma B factor antagonist